MIERTPWVVERFGGSWLIIDAGDYTCPELVEWTVAELLHGKDNAYLMAAVPELYKVAEQVEYVGRLADDPTSDDELLTAKVQVLRDMAKAAIAKVKEGKNE